MVKRKKTVNILSDNIIYRPKLDDETNDLINDLNDEIILLKSEIHKLNNEIDTNKKTIKELESKPKPKKIYNVPRYPIYYMYIPLYQSYQIYNPYIFYPNIYFNYPLCY